MHPKRRLVDLVLQWLVAEIAGQPDLVANTKGFYELKRSRTEPPSFD